MGDSRGQQGRLQVCWVIVKDYMIDTGLVFDRGEP